MNNIQMSLTNVESNKHLVELEEDVSSFVLQNRSLPQAKDQPRLRNFKKRVRLFCH